MITALIPCYNAEEYLAEALDSVLAQTQPVDEIIVVDDCSTDSSRGVASGYPVRLLSTERNSGHATARNIGIRAARGDVIAWLDADDYWEPNHIEIVAALLDKYPEAAVAYSGVRRFGSWSGVWSNGFCDAGPTNAFWRCFESTMVPAMSAVTRRQALLDVGGFDESIKVAPDYDLWLRLSLDHRFVSVSEVTSNYRGHHSQISRKRLTQWESVYAARWRMITHLRNSAHPADTRAMEEEILATWDKQLLRSYYGRRMDEVKVLLSFSRYTPGETQVSRRLRRRCRIPKTVFVVWDTLTSLKSSRAELKEAKC